MVIDKSVSSRVLDVVIHTALILLLVVTLYPIAHVVAVSLSNPAEIMKGNVGLFPRGVTWSTYHAVFRAGTVPNGMKNSVIYTVLGTSYSMVLTVLMAYPLSKKYLQGRTFYSLIVIITMYISGGLIPSFLLVAKWMNLYDTIAAVILPAGVDVFNMIMMRTFFQSMSEELEESARIDGANDAYILFHIVLPLAKAILATIGLFYAVGYWDMWFPALVYFGDSEKYPLQLILRNIVLQGQVAREMAEAGSLDDSSVNTIGYTSESIKYATLCISMLPMLIVYPFIQKYFVKGVMIGALKG